MTIKQHNPLFKNMQTEEKIDFENKLNNKGGLSLWTIWITILMIITDATLTLTGIPMLHKEPTFKIRCLIPELENIGLSFDEIQKISQSSTSNCTYYDYDYSRLKLLDYYEMLEFITLEPKPALIKCNECKMDENTEHSSIYKDVLLYCIKDVENAINIAPFLGMAIGYTFFVPFGDIYGRKTLLIFGLNSLTATILVQNFVKSTNLYIIARFITGIAYAPVRAAIDALVVELSNTLHRPYRFYIVHLHSSFSAYLLLPLMSKMLKNWRYVQLFCSIGICIFPLVKWYIPESPRWYYSKMQVGKAWTLLKNLRNPVIVSEVLTRFSNDRNYCDLEIGMQMEKFQSIHSYKFWLTLILAAVTGAIYMKNFAVNFDDRFIHNSYLYSSFRGMSELISLSICIPFTYGIGRKLSVFGCQFVTTIASFILSGDRGMTQNRILYFTLDTTTSGSFAISKLHLMENVPTTHRCTVLGLLGFLTSVYTILLFVAIQYLQNNVFFLLVGVVSLVSLIINVYIIKDNKDNLYDIYDEIKNH